MKEFDLEARKQNVRPADIFDDALLDLERYALFGAPDECGKTVEDLVRGVITEATKVPAVLKNDAEGQTVQKITLADKITVWTALLAVERSLAAIYTYLFDERKPRPQTVRHMIFDLCELLRDTRGIFEAQAQKAQKSASEINETRLQ